MIFAAENVILYDICVLVLWGKKEETGTHSHTHQHEHENEHRIYFMCFTSYQRIWGKHNTNNIRLCVLHVSLCYEIKVANISRDAEQADEAHNVQIDVICCIATSDTSIQNYVVFSSSTSRE